MANVQWVIHSTSIESRLLMSTSIVNRAFGVKFALSLSGGVFLIIYATTETQIINSLRTRFRIILENVRWLSNFCKLPQNESKDRHVPVCTCYNTWSNGVMGYLFPGLDQRNSELQGKPVVRHGSCGSNNSWRRCGAWLNLQQLGTSGPPKIFPALDCHEPTTQPVMLEDVTGSRILSTGWWLPILVFSGKCLVAWCQAMSTGPTCVHWACMQSFSVSASPVPSCTKEHKKASPTYRSISAWLLGSPVHSWLSWETKLTFWQ